MERRRVEIDVEELTITEAKAEYLLREKRVSYLDILEVLDNTPRYFEQLLEDGGARHSMLGPNVTGRFLVVAIAHEEGTTWRVVTAYWLRPTRGRRLYEEGKIDD